MHTNPTLLALPSHHHGRRLASALLGAVLATLLVACGDDDGSAAITQVAAQVGSEEISVSQINQVLNSTRAPDNSPEALRQRSRDVLEKLIDQQVAVHQATETKLHRTPEVVAQLEAARRDILARAYLKQITNGLAVPTPEEVSAYYSANPALFSGRRIFTVQEVVVPRKADATVDVATEFRRFAAGSASMEEVAGWLGGKDIAFGGGSATRAAEQIPLDLLPLLNALSDGQSTVVETPASVTLLRVISSQSAPVDEAAASPSIAQFLTNRRATDAVTGQIRLLRDATTITYRGEFEAPVAAGSTGSTGSAGNTGTAGAAGTAEAATPPLILTAEPPAKDSTTATPAPTPTAQDKGLAGLK